jgi:hypothetical protein
MNYTTAITTLTAIANTTPDSSNSKPDYGYLGAVILGVAALSLSAWCSYILCKGDKSKQAPTNPQPSERELALLPLFRNYNSGSSLLPDEKIDGYGSTHENKISDTMMI